MLVPDGTRLLHIGPPKTGTTAIQGAFHRARPQLSEHGVVYAGEDQHPYRAALGVLGTRHRDGALKAGIEHWDQLVAEVGAVRDRRVVISSEFFAEADEKTARVIVDALGPSSVHVVVTLRPLAKILPSAWQQYVRNRLRTPYTRWLRQLLEAPPGEVQRSNFWRRHRHDDLVARWAALVGPEQVTVVVVDDSDRLFLPRTFEALTGLPEGTLVPEADTENRSLTHGETELIRAINNRVHRLGWSTVAYRDIVRQGLVPALQAREPQRSEVRTMTPQWAVELATERSVEAAANIRAMGVRVVGDLDSLATPPSRTASRNLAGVVPSAAAAEGIIGAVQAAAVGMPELAEDGLADGRSVDQMPTHELARALARRVRTRTGRVVRERRHRGLGA